MIADGIPPGVPALEPSTVRGRYPVSRHCIYSSRIGGKTICDGPSALHPTSSS